MATIADSVVKGQQKVFIDTILNGTSTTNGVDMGVYRAVGLSIPAAFTGTTLTFKSSYSGNSHVPVHDSSGSAISVTVGPSRRVVLNPANFYGIRHLQIVSGSAESADRVITIVCEA